MPFDSSGKHHLNTQKAMAADKSRGASATSAKPEPKAKSMEQDAKTPSGGSHTIHDNGDGTFHTESNGEQTQHPSIHSALAHVGHKVTGGKHVHLHHDGSEVKGATADENGTEDHATTDEAKASTDEMFSGASDSQNSDNSDHTKEHSDPVSYRMLSGL